GQFPVLADVAHVDRAEESRRIGEALALEVLEGLPLEGSEDLVRLADFEEAHAHPEGPRVVEARVREQRPERREGARVAGHEDAADLERTRELARVKRAGATVGHERRASRV